MNDIAVRTAMESDVSWKWTFFGRIGEKTNKFPVNLISPPVY